MSGPYPGIMAQTSCQRTRQLPFPSNVAEATDQYRRQLEDDQEQESKYSKSIRIQ